MPAVSNTMRTASQTQAQGSGQSPPMQAQTGSSTSTADVAAPTNSPNGDAAASVGETIGALEEVRDLIAEEMLRTAASISEAVADGTDVPSVTDSSEPRDQSQGESSREGEGDPEAQRNAT